MGIVVAMQHTIFGGIGTRVSLVMGFCFVVAFLCHGSNFPVAMEVIRHFDASHELYYFSKSTVLLKVQSNTW